MLGLGFIGSGLVTTLLGTVLPIITKSWQLSDRRAAVFFFVQFAASTIGVLLSPVVLRFVGAKSLFAIGYGLMAFGIGCFAARGFTLAIICAAMYGSAIGLTIPSTNLMVAALFPQRRTAALNLLNMVWGIGAVVCPPLLGALLEVFSLKVSLAVLGSLVGFVVLAIAVWFRQPDVSTAHNVAKPEVPALMLVSFGLLFFLYVGTEACVYGWIALLTQRSGGSTALWISAPALFWAALIVGRLVAAAQAKLTDANLARVSLTVTFVGICCILLAPSPIWVVLGSVISGFGCGPVYPSVIAALVRRSEELGTTAPQWMFALAGLGGAILPWVIGAASAAQNNLRSAMALTIVPTLAMIVLLSGAGVRSSKAETVMMASPDRS